MRKLYIIPVILTVLVGSYFILSWIIQGEVEHSVFQPSRQVFNDLSAYQLTTTSLILSDATTVQALYKITSSPYCLLFFHGNSGNITSNTSNIDWLDATGYSYYLVDYPGYGQSTGQPTEQNLYDSAVALYQFALTHGCAADTTVDIGQSLGGAVAVDLAAQQPVRAVVVVSSLASTFSIIEKLYPYIPIQLFLRNQFVSVDKVAKITAPIVFIHGTVDATLPFHQSELLFAAAKEPKWLELVPQAGHATVVSTLGQDQFVSTIKNFVTTLTFKPN